MRQVLRAGALGRPRGIQWGGRWEGGSGWGIHVNPWLIHVSLWQKSLQYCKVISFQLIKINEKKIEIVLNILYKEYFIIISGTYSNKQGRKIFLKVELGSFRKTTICNFQICFLSHT